MTGVQTCALPISKCFFEDGEIKMQENALSKHRKSISIYNTVEQQNKHPKLFINYLRVLAEAKGIKFEIQAKPEGKTTTKKKTKTNAKVEQILKSRDLSPEEYERLGLRKKVGKTTTQENLQFEKFYWQQFFSTSKLDEDVLRNFLYEKNLFWNFL